MAPDRKFNLSPAIDGTQRRLDVLIEQNEQIIKLLTPAQPEPAAEPERGETDLREPAKPRKKKAAAQDD